MGKSTESVKVVVRCRPFNSREKASNEKSIVVVNEKRNTIDVEKPTGERKQFTFDQVFGEASKQLVVFEQVARPIIDSVVRTYMYTAFICISLFKSICRGLQRHSLCLWANGHRQNVMQTIIWLAVH
jgi:hypothetical protein